MAYPRAHDTLGTMRRLATLLIAALLPISASAQPEEPGRPIRPNVLLILADDLGYGDLGSYNPESKIPTPHLDRLAREGMRFTQAYCPDAVCTPTRYALMTGRYSWRTSHQLGVLANWEPPLIGAERITLPGMLQRAGYQTGGFGKWHLGADFASTDGHLIAGFKLHRHPRNGINLNLNRPLAGGPLDRGFDAWYGFICASENLVYDGARAVARVDIYPDPLAPGVERLEPIRLPDFLGRVTARALEFLDQAAGAARQTPQPWFLYFAPYVPHTPLAVPVDVRGRTRAGDYGDYVAALDDAVGRLLAAIDQRGLAADTLVFFASDNGSQFAATGEGHRPNGPLRGSKGSVWDGGVRTPLIARWPARIAAGGTSTHLVALPDLLTTLARMTGQTLPAGAAEDSFDFLPELLGNAPARVPRESVVLKSRGHHFALRAGDWKYHAPAGPAPGSLARSSVPARLYHLPSDPGESHDVSSAHPEKVQELAEELITILQGRRTAPEVP